MINELLTKDIRNNINNNSNEITKIKDGEIYSTSEIKTNKIWIDGKPIYRCVVQGHFESDKRLDFDISWLNIQTPISMNGLLYNSTDSIGGSYRAINSYGSTNNRNLIQLNGSQEKITSLIAVAGPGPYCAGNFNCILEYTKTTD